MNTPWLRPSVQSIRLKIAAVLLSLYCPLSAHAEAALDRAVASVCDMDVVALGEDLNHGAGGTLDLRVKLLLRLVQECGFKAVAFESPIYDFLDYTAAVRTGRANEAMLLDALGGLWSVTREVDPLVKVLHAAQVAGKVQLLGLDNSLGGATQLYSGSVLPRELSATLPGSNARHCQQALLRYTQWQYTSSSPFNEAALKALQGCASELRSVNEASTKTGDEHAVERAWVSRNIDEFFAAHEFPVHPVRAKRLNQRSATFEANLRWHRARMAPGTRIILWLATVHGARRGHPDVEGHVPLGLKLARDPSLRFASIGFSALRGTWDRPGQPGKTLPHAEPESLEAYAFMHNKRNDEAVQWLFGASLQSAGTREGRALNYLQPQRVKWSDYLDGLIVVREESPMKFARPAKPQQLPR